MRTIIVHIHTPKLRRFFDFEDVILLDFFLPCIDLVDCLVAPDEGAGALVTALGNVAKKPVIIMRKKRITPEKIEHIAVEEEVSGQKVLIIDDMIATGRTIVDAAEMVKSRGAAEIFVAATHGIFSGDAVRSIEASPIKQVFVTNSLKPHVMSRKIEVVDCASSLEQIIFSSQ